MKLLAATIALILSFTANADYRPQSGDAEAFSESVSDSASSASNESSLSSNVDSSSSNSISFFEENPSTIKIIGGATTTSYTNSTADCLITGAGLFKRSVSILGGIAFGARQEVDAACVERALAQADSSNQHRTAELLIAAGYSFEAAALLLGREVAPLPPTIDPEEFERLQRELSQYRLREASRSFIEK